MSNEAKKIHIEKRVREVCKQLHAFHILMEHGIEISDQYTDEQIRCPWHGVDNKPSARYYSDNGGRFYCHRCKEGHNTVSLFAKFKGYMFMEALSKLEKRLGIIIEKFNTEFIEEYERSKGWEDVKRCVNLVESKIKRIRNKCPFYDYVKFCSIVDDVLWEFEKGTTDLNKTIVPLVKVSGLIDEIYELPEEIFTHGFL